MAEQEQTKDPVVEYETEDKTNKISLTDASKSGFNDRAWNDPPPMLMNSSSNSGTQNKDTPRPKKLSTRVAFPLGGTAPLGNTVLDPFAPPPMMGFVASSGAPPKASPPPIGPPSSLSP